MPCFDKRFTVHIDASDISIGAFLVQEYDGLNMPVCFFSKHLTKTEAKLSVYKRELHVIIQALGKQHWYLVNCNTVVFTDHQLLKYFMSQPKLSARQFHWLNFLVDFFLDV